MNASGDPPCRLPPPDMPNSTERIGDVIVVAAVGLIPVAIILCYFFTDSMLIAYNECLYVIKYLLGPMLLIVIAIFMTFLVCMGLYYSIILPVQKMIRPRFPRRAINILRESLAMPESKASVIEPFGVFVWSDEKYTDFVNACEAAGCLRGYEPVLFRNSVILGSPREDLRLSWDELLRLVPLWPGFLPARVLATTEHELRTAMAMHGTEAKYYLVEKT